MFGGLTSRWTIRWACAPASARHSCAAIPAACHGAIGPRAQPLRQVLAGHQLRDVVATLGRMPDVVDLDDPGVRDPRQQPRLTLEVGHPLGILGPPRLDHLDRDRALQTAVAARVDAAERPLADHGVEFIAVVERGARKVRNVRHACGGSRGEPMKVLPAPGADAAPGCKSTRRRLSPEMAPLEPTANHCGSAAATRQGSRRATGRRPVRTDHPPATAAARRHRLDRP